MIRNNCEVQQMIEVNAKKARGELSSLLKRVEEGEEVVISRRGRKVAKMVSLREGPRKLPSLEAFRAEVRISGGTLSQTVVRSREEERY
jgi:prevent-host-death family protein